MERAVHRLHSIEVVSVDLESREHVFGVVVKMPRYLPQVFASQMRAVDKLESISFMHPARVIFGHLSKHPAVGMPHREPGAELARE